MDIDDDVETLVREATDAFCSGEYDHRYYRHGIGNGDN